MRLDLPCFQVVRLNRVRLAILKSAEAQCETGFRLQIPSRIMRTRNSIWDPLASSSPEALIGGNFH